MSFSRAELALTIADAQAALVGGLIERIVELEGPAIAFESYARGRKSWFLLSARPGFSRAHLLSSRPRDVETPGAFVMLLRKHAARIGGCALWGDDRVVRLRLVHRDGEASIIAELVGRHANVFLVGPDDVILGSLRPNLSQRRALVVGAPYVYPLPAEAASGALRDAPRFGSAGSADGAVSAEAEALYARLEAEATRRELAGSLQRALREAHKRIVRRQAAIAGDRARAEAAEPYQVLGSLLLANLGRVRRGAVSITATDYSSEPPREVEIALDPALGAKANAERYFARYRRFRDGLRLVATQEEKAVQELSRVESWLARAVAAEEQAAATASLAPLTALRDELVARRLLRGTAAGASSGRRRPREAPSEPFRRFVSRDGKPILVGKGSAHNDALTFKVARGNDLWMHTRDYPGAHVVVPLGRDEEVLPETLLDAASLAAHYSQAKDATVVDVAYTRRKHVHKPRGAAPGLVSVSEARTLAVRLQPERLERLLRKRDLGE